MNKSLKINIQQIPVIALVISCVWVLPCQNSYAQDEPHTYEPTVQSLKKHEVPQWYRDAKLGIFVHWGLYSVPGWAPVNVENKTQEWKYHPYAEWYWNTMKIDGSPTQQYHNKKYGEEFGYYDFVKIFNQKSKQWKPEQWADLFNNVHARYVVLTTKHHDGFLLWPSAFLNPYLPKGKRHAERNIVGELTEAVRDVGLKMGFYYSGGIDWTFKPIVSRSYEVFGQTTPQTPQYANYADFQWMELINKYHPAILWNDITYPKKGDALKIFAHYYNTVPNGVINDRWGRKVFDFTTPEYTTMDSITTKKWETTRGIALSFGYNRHSTDQQFLSVNKLVDMFVDIVSKGGNLLLNVGPKANGTIPQAQKKRLKGLGHWLDTNGEAIFGTRPWLVAEGQTVSGIPIRFTFKDGQLYAILLEKPDNNTIIIKNIIAAENSELHLLGATQSLQWSNEAEGIKITLPENMENAPAYSIRFDTQPTLKMRK